VSRFVTDAVVTLPLSDGDTITVRARLTHGQTEDLYRRCLRDWTPDMPDEARYQHDRLKAPNAMVVAYLVDWTLRDAAGRVEHILGLPPEELLDVIRNLDQPTFSELFAVINAHDEAGRTAQKKTAVAIA
jgi:hypothetical protein